MKYRRVMLGVGGILMCFALNISGQICAGSHMVYIVRDAKGAPIKSGQEGLAIEGKNDVRNASWHIYKDEFLSPNLGVAPPDNIRSLNGKVTWLAASGMCHFKMPLELKLSYKGKTMELTFVTKYGSEYHSADYVVDSIPFKAGHYQIVLGSEMDIPSGFFPASGWKKVN